MINIKKCIYMVFAILLLTLLPSCDTDPYKGKRPTDYINSCWLSENSNYSMYFEVNNMNESILRIDDGEIIHFEFLWSAFDSGVNVYEYGKSGYTENLLFKGECKFGKSKFEVKLSEKYDICVGLPDTLIFERVG